MTEDDRGSDVHVMPVNDLREHEASLSCWCRPKPDDEFTPGLYVHSSMDGREDFETGKRKPS